MLFLVDFNNKLIFLHISIYLILAKIRILMKKIDYFALYLIEENNNEK